MNIDFEIFAYNINNFIILQFSKPANRISTGNKHILIKLDDNQCA